ncbi:type II toxin-antitoxin system mRNA interferase toxin, RelE/StbE family [Candidatus Peregrinibacteria bacterium]|nr:type II toxin-antitoxin system mRNA interferase toxin, RelE/StbE family [Candidatus Peregrinibacteria bacterium]
MEIIFSRNFKKQAKKISENSSSRKEKINTVIKDFSMQGRGSEFYRKKLKGNWYGYEELQLGGDIRIIFREKGNVAVFEAIGTHSQLELS